MYIIDHGKEYKLNGVGFRMKILIANDDNNIAVVKDFEGMNKGLIAQTILEMHVLEEELTRMYVEDFG